MRKMTAHGHLAAWALAAVLALVSAGVASGAQPAQAATCTTSALSGSCGPYLYPAITASNGHNTYVNNNMWGCGDGSCGPQTLTVTDPGGWQVASTQAAGNTAIRTYPDVQQLYASTDTSQYPLSGFSAIYSTFADSLGANSGTDAEAGYDLWLNGYNNEIMIWTDTHRSGGLCGGAPFVQWVTIYKVKYAYCSYGDSAEQIFQRASNVTSGKVHILATLHWLVRNGHLPASDSVSDMQYGFEIASTGGQPETFTVTGYTLTTTMK